MAGALDWPWNESLALAREGDVLEVKEILFGSLRDHLQKVGVRKGSTLEHLGRNDDGVDVRLQDGRGVRVDRDHAWFIVVEPGVLRTAVQE